MIESVFCVIVWYPLFTEVSGSGDGEGGGVNLKNFKKGWKYGAGAGLLKRGGEAATFPI